MTLTMSVVGGRCCLETRFPLSLKPGRNFGTGKIEISSRLGLGCSCAELSAALPPQAHARAEASPAAGPRVWVGAGQAGVGRQSGCFLPLRCCRPKQLLQHREPKTATKTMFFFTLQWLLCWMINDVLICFCLSLFSFLFYRLEVPSAEPTSSTRMFT